MNKAFPKFVTLVLIGWSIILIVSYVHLLQREKAFDAQEPEVVTKTEIQVEQPAIIIQNFDPVELVAEDVDYSTNVHVTKRMAQVHELAEMARALGLSEDSPVIQEAQAIWAEEKYNLDIMAKTVSVEAPGCPYTHQLAVACVVKNRVNSPKFPNTYYEVIVQPGQYNKKYAQDFDNVADEFYAVAKTVLDGEYSIPENVLYQANHKNGTGVWWISHVKTPYWESYTYFCYG